jgi:hypothetical protein
MTKSDPLAALERLRSVLDEKRPTSQQLADASDRLRDIIAAANSELESIEGLMDSAADSAPVEAEKTLEKLDERARAARRRIRIAESVLRAIEARRDEALEDERASARLSAYETALKLHDDATQRVKMFLDRVGPEATAVLRAYVESERATSAANADLPPGVQRIQSIEQERMGAAPPPKIVERHFKAFVRGRDFVAEHGQVEASPVGGNIWTVFLPSNSIQGGTSVGGCELADFVDVKIEKFEPARPQVLSAALSVPSFYAPPPERGRVERKRMRLSEWRSLNGEPVEAEQELV